MYADDCPKIAAFAAESPDNLFRVGLFVQATINQHFEQVPRMLASYDAFGLGSKDFMRWQKRAIKTLSIEAPRLHDFLWNLHKRKRSAEHYLLRELVELPGFGLVKAGFFAQLIWPWGNIGCLDRHNLRLYGLSEKAFSRTPTSTEGLTRKINTYLSTCKREGGAEVLWNNWCAHIARIRPYAFADAEAVSQLHVKCIIGEAA